MSTVQPEFAAFSVRFPSRQRGGNLQEGGNCNTNRRAKVYKSVGFESPLTPTLSPLDKGGD
jgi:hypothetical protein